MHTQMHTQMHFAVNVRSLVHRSDCVSSPHESMRPRYLPSGRSKMNTSGSSSSALLIHLREDVFKDATSVTRIRFMARHDSTL